MGDFVLQRMSLYYSGWIDTTTDGIKIWVNFTTDGLIDNSKDGLILQRMG
jgi:hypothetical protein